MSALGGEIFFSLVQMYHIETLKLIANQLTVWSLGALTHSRVFHVAYLTE
jgi:hypothetical protein